ncbi:12793_t:CDS:1, partial [Dentiscutata heterogama]
PFKIVENPWFHKMISALDSRYVPPTRIYIKEKLISQFKDQKILVAEKLSISNNKIALIANI